jgi:hypothetical protein
LGKNAKVVRLAAESATSPAAGRHENRVILWEVSFGAVYLNELGAGCFGGICSGLMAAYEHSIPPEASTSLVHP